MPEIERQRDRRVWRAAWAGRQAPLEHEHYLLLKRPRPFAVGQLRGEQLPQARGKFQYCTLQRLFPAGSLLPCGAHWSWRIDISAGMGNLIATGTLGRIGTAATSGPGFPD